jgi:hypothetical protein
LPLIATSSARHVLLRCLVVLFLAPLVLAEGNPLGYDYVRTEVQTVSSVDRVLAYDPNLRRVYAVNPTLNRIEVISVASRSIAQTIDVPQPTSVDVSVDGTKLVIGTNSNYFYTADTTTGRLTGRFTFTFTPPGQTAVQQLVPIGVTYMNDGTVLIRSQNQFASPFLLRWDPVSNSISTAPFNNPPFISSFNSFVVRSGDHKKALIIGSSQIQIYEAASNSIIATKTYVNNASLSRGFLNADGSKVFVGVSTFGPPYISELDGALIEKLQIPVTSLSAFVISPDASKVFTSTTQCCGPFVFQRRDANPGSPTAGQLLAGGIPDALAGFSSGSTILSEVTETGVMIGFSGPGVLFIDPSKASLFNGVNAPNLGFSFFTPRAASLNAAVQATVGNGFNLTPITSAYFGNNPATNISPIFSPGFPDPVLTGFNMAVPASSDRGPVNWVARFDSGWTTLLPQAFTYGPKILYVRTSAGSPAGGDTISIVGYGLGVTTGTPPTNPPSVTIGGQAATVQNVQSVFFDNTPVQEIVATSPPGNGIASVTVTNDFGSDTVNNAFTYANDIHVYAKTGPLNFLLYDAGRKRLYASNSSKIERFDVGSKQFLSALQPSTVTSDTVFQGLSLTPDGSKLIAADSGGKLVHIIDPDAGTATAVSVASFSPFSFSGPQRVVALSNGKVFVSQTGGCGTPCVVTLNLADNSVTPVSDPALSTVFNNLDPVGTPDGTRVLLADSVLYDATRDIFITGPGLSAGPVLFSPFSISNDGQTYSSSLFGSTTIASLTDFTRRNSLTDSPLLQSGQGVAVLHSSGGLIYRVGPNQFAFAANSVDIWDTNTGRMRLRIPMPEPFNQFQINPKQLTPDDTGRMIFTVTATGLTVVTLDNSPLNIAHLSPSIASDNAGEIVTVRGSGFKPGAMLQIGTTMVNPTFVDERTLTFADPGLSDGSYPVIVTNPGGESYTLGVGFTSGPPNPAPALDSISPNTRLVLDATPSQNGPLTLTLNGSNFVASSTVMWNGIALTTSFVNAAQLQATVPVSLLSRVGTAQIMVVNPLPDGGSSTVVPFSVTAPVPTITQPSTPITLFANSGTQFFTINGSGFINQSVGLWDGMTALQGSRSNSSFSVTVPASLLTSAGSHQFTIVNPAPGGGTSNAIPVNVIVSVPTLKISPTSADFSTIGLGRTAFQIGAVAISGADYSIAFNSCSNAPLQFFGCQITVQFTPTVSGARAGSLTIPSNDPNSPTIVTLQGVGDNAPVLRLSVTPLGGTAPVTVTASTDGSFDTDGVIVSARFDFGDGTSAQASPATHTYTHAGIFTLTAAVFDNQGVASVASVLIDVGNKRRSDFNGDGQADIVWRRQTGETAIWFMSGTFLSSSQFLSRMSDTNWQIAGVGDFDGDGRSDILWRNITTGENKISFMDGATVLNEQSIATLSDQNWQVAGVADFDGDNKADILWRNGSSGNNAIWLMNGASFVSTQFIPRVADLRWQIVGVGDFDGDGKADILWRHQSSGDNAMWFMNGTTLLSSQFITKLADQNWQVAGVGDFNRDGTTDILWRNHSSGQNAIWLMNGGSIFQSQFIFSILNQDWQPAAVSDFNGDGATDILWRNQRTGENAIWLMNGTNTIFTQFILPVDPNWTAR